MAARPGTSTYGSYRPQRPCSTIPLGVHLHTGHAAVSGARGGPRGRTSSRRPRWWSAHILYGRYGHIGRLSVSPIQIVWGFHHTFKYCKTFVLFQKLTGGGDSTLLWSLSECLPVVSGIVKIPDQTKYSELQGKRGFLHGESQNLPRCLLLF